MAGHKLDRKIESPEVRRMTRDYLARVKLAERALGCTCNPSVRTYPTFSIKHGKCCPRYGQPLPPDPITDVIIEEARRTYTPEYIERLKEDAYQRADARMRADQEAWRQTPEGRRVVAELRAEALSAGRPEVKREGENRALAALATRARSGAHGAAE